MVMTEHRGPVQADLQVSMQISLFAGAELRCPALTNSFQSIDEQSSVLFEPGWVEGSDRVFEELRDEMPWRSMERPMYDRVVDVPRLICTVAPGALGAGHPLATITAALERALGASFLSVGLNYYRTGNDSVAWHRDRVGRTVRPATVALVSVGSPRTLALRPHGSHPSKTAATTQITPATPRRWSLGHGDLLVMAGRCQRDWEHCVPKERAVGPRISLAFRSQ